MSERLFRVTSPSSDHLQTPLAVSIPGLSRPLEFDWYLEDVESREKLALQPEGGRRQASGSVRFILPSIARGQERRFRLKQGPKAPLRAEVQPVAGDQWDMRLNREAITTYHYGKSWARPFLFPLKGAGGVNLTRGWPMVDAPDEKTDHEHHKSLWSAYGDLNGVDIWTEMDGHGRVEHEEFVEKSSGPVFCRFCSRENWLASSGERVLRSTTEVTLHALPDDQRLLDYVISFFASDGPVRFGDTKEGGLISLRLTASMNGDRGGLIENSNGGRTESECWGKSAAWVDYSGPVQGQTHGVAIFDHPDNPCFPTRWHVRDYGLFTANPFALHDYMGSNDVDGSALLEPDTPWRFHYRVYLHSGGAKEGRVQDKFLAFTEPPLVEEIAREG